MYPDKIRKWLEDQQSPRSYESALPVGRQPSKSSMIPPFSCHPDQPRSPSPKPRQYKPYRPQYGRIGDLHYSHTRSRSAPRPDELFLPPLLPHSCRSEEGRNLPSHFNRGYCPPGSLTQQIRDNAKASIQKQEQTNMSAQRTSSSRESSDARTSEKPMVDEFALVLSIHAKTLTSQPVQVSNTNWRTTNLQCTEKLLQSGNSIKRRMKDSLARPHLKTGFLPQPYASGEWLTPPADAKWGLTCRLLRDPPRSAPKAEAAPVKAEVPSKTPAQQQSAKPDDDIAMMSFIRTPSPLFRRASRSSDDKNTATKDRASQNPSQLPHEVPLIKARTCASATPIVADLTSTLKLRAPFKPF